MSDNSQGRVVITGMGLVSPLGLTPDQLWSALEEGQSGVSRLTSVPTEFLPTHIGGEARQFTGNIDDFGELEKTVKRTIKKGLKLMCREIEMGVAAAQRALQHASLDQPGKYDPERTGAVYGSDYIMTLPDEFTAGIRKCIDEDGQFDFSRWAEEGMPEVTPLWLLKYLPNMPASHIAIYNDLRGPNNSITLREASGNLAVAEAYNTIVRGSADIMVAGATGTRIHPLRTVHVVLQEEIANGEDPAKACRPFDLNRSGMVVGEGSGAVVLETLSSAQSRGATIYGEVVGHGSSTVLDRKCVAKLDEALANAMRQALRNTGMDSSELGHVHAHGLATHHCDAQESKAINAVFADRRDSIPVTAAKSYFGNLGAGGGIVELIASLLALQNDRLFPVLNYETPDPDCAINVVHGEATSPGNSFINCNVTPQGQASAVVVRKH